MMAAQDQPFDSTSTLRSVRTYKGKLTSVIKVATNIIGIAAGQVPPSALILEDLAKQKTKAEGIIGQISDKYAELIANEDDDVEANRLQTNWDTELARYNDIFNRICTALQRAPASQGQTQAQQPGRTPQKVEVNKLLKPNTLMKDDTPVIMSSWIRSFKQWYTASKMTLATIPEQQAYFKHCLDPYLESRLNEKIDANTPVFPGEQDAETSCVELLQHEFRIRYPIVSRQYEFFRAKQQTGQLFSDWATTLRRMGDEANLHEMTTEDIYIMRYITGASDPKLKEKFLKEPKPSLTLFNEIVDQHEIAGNINASQEQPPRINAIQQQKTPTIRELEDQGRCVKCGSQEHTKTDCQIPATVECRACGTPGHFAKVCQRNNGKANAEYRRQKAREKRAKKKGKVKAITEAKDDDDDDDEEAFTKVEKVKSVMGALTEPAPKMNITLTGPSDSVTSEALADTGSTRTLVSKELAGKMGLDIRQSRIRLSAANNSPISCEGQAHVTLTYKGYQTQTLAIITADIPDEVIVGLSELKALGVIPDNFPNRTHNNRVCRVNLDSINLLRKDYADVFSNQLKDEPMAGPPMTIHLKTGAKASRVFTARQYPIHWAKAAEEAVDKLLETVLVEETEPTEWISPGFFVLKGDPVEKKAKKIGLTGVTRDDLRLVVDYTALNKWVERPIHPFPSAQDIIDRIPAGSRYFAVMDLTKGYHQVPLDEVSSKLTTFLLPSGRYRFTRAPMGLNSSSDEFCRRSDEVIRGVPNTQKIVDDILLCGTTEMDLYCLIRQVLERCRNLRITVSEKKFVVDTQVKFAGFIISKDGTRPDPDKVKAIAEFKPPKDKTGLRSFLGLANQLGAFYPDIAHMSTALRPLTSKTMAFTWLPDHQQAFDSMKRFLTSSVIVKFFDCSLQTEVLTDASRLKGLGYALVQRNPDGAINLVSCGSRSLSGAESRYATVELECLAITFALEKCRHYLIGMPTFRVITDHKPLIGVFQKRIDETTNARLLRMREKLSNYTFTVEWVHGKNHLIADCLSRAPEFDAPEEGPDIVYKVMAVTIAEDPQLQGLYDAALESHEYQATLRAIQSGKDVKQMPYDHYARTLQSVWQHMSTFEDTLLVVDAARIVVPPSAKDHILARLHASHSGLSKTRAAAKDLFFWPGMNADIKNMIQGCHKCQELRPSQPHEPIHFHYAEEPMDEVGIDLMQARGRHFMVMVDRFSGMPFMHELKSLNTRAVTCQLLRWFQDFGFPRVIRSDNGPQFRSDFTEFCKTHGIRHETSSPYNPKSNGLAEAAVKNCKMLLLKCPDDASMRNALLEFRNTPRMDGSSPAQRFFGRRQRTTIPALPAARSSINIDDSNSAKEKLHQNIQQPGYVLPDLKIGDRVRVQNPITRRWDQLGTIIEVLPNGRSYNIRLHEDDTKVRRSRRFIKFLPDEKN